MKAKVSVVIPTYNSWVTLRKCITSVKNQTLKPHEIIVINNSSTDSTAVNVKKHFPGVRLINLTQNTGVTGGRNAGIKASDKKSDFVFFFDHDMVADKKMLEELTIIANRHTKVGITTPKIYYWTDKKRIWAAGTGMNLWTGQVLFRGGQDNGQYNLATQVQVAPAAMLVKREVLQAVKSFDPTYFAVYEDTDFSFRTKEAGFDIYYAPKAVAYHILSTDPKDEIDRLLSRAYWVGRNRVIFMKRHGKSFVVFLLFMPVFVLYYFTHALKNNRFSDGLKFLRGTVDGIFSK